MARYLDSGSGERSQCVGHWLDVNLVPGLRGFRAQFGYFRYAALASYADAIRHVAEAGYPVHLVLGSNQGSLVAADVQRALRVVQGPAATVTVVAFGGAEFHPKVVHVVRADGSSAAIVGSANLTENGLGRNVEAALALDVRDHDDPDVLQRIANAIERWHGLAEAGVFRIETDADVQNLVDQAIINLPQPGRPAVVPRRAGRGRTVLGRRERAWAPRRVPGVVIGLGLIPPPRPVPAPPAPPVGAAEPAAVVGGPHAVIVRQWCKELHSSDAQQVRLGTNPTGKLRLTESGFGIDHTVFFRGDFFSTAPWREDVRRGQRYEVTEVPFLVKVRGVPKGELALMIDHAPHRIAGQGNVSTVLRWGPELGAALRAANHVGDWVVITRDAAGAFTLTIQTHRPAWAP